MDPILGLLLLFALSRKKDGSAPWSTSSSHASTPSTGPTAFPPVPATIVHPTTSPSVHAGARWVPYVPLVQAVIDRANALLHDPTMHPNEERIEPDPASGGQVRYLKLSAPPGHTSVTAWKPTLLQPAAGAPTAAAPQGAHMVPASYSPVAPPPAASGRTLKRGMSGPDVAQWQRFLGTGADGKFGPGTEAATKVFQRAHGLQADGIVGPNTRNAAHLAAA